MSTPSSHTWKQSRQVATRILSDKAVLERQLRLARKKLQGRPGLPGDVGYLPDLVWTFATGECMGPSYNSVLLSLTALNFSTASTNLRDLLGGRERLEDVLHYVCRTIDLDLQDFKRWHQARIPKT